MALWSRPGYHLTEAEIRCAISYAHSAADAARYLHISQACFKKYAEMYYDHKSGMNLYEYLKKHKKKRRNFKAKYQITLEDIFANKHPWYSITRLKERILQDGIFEEKCNICGFHEQRMTDLTVGLCFVFKDGNRKNFSKDNLEFVCWNCFYLYYGDVREKRYININEVEFYGKLTTGQ